MLATIIDHYPLETRPTKFDSAFDAAGEFVGLEMWEVHEVKKSISVTRYEATGKLRVSNAYIALNTTAGSDGVPTYTIHFWIGSETPQASIDTAVAKCTELHLKVGGIPVHYREVEGFESSVFMSYFKADGIEYLPMTDSPTNTPRFFHVKGKREKRIKEISASMSYLSDTDVFVLDAVDKLFVYTGKAATRYDFRLAMAYADHIKKTLRGEDFDVVQVDNAPSEYKSFLEDTTYSDLSHRNAEFYSYLKDTPNVMSLNYEVIQTDPIKLSFEPHLFRMKLVANRDIEFEETAIGERLSRNTLQSDSAYVLLGGGTGDFTYRSLFVWVGGAADETLKHNAVSSGLLYMHQARLPLASTTFQRLCEGAVTKEFRLEFPDWTVDPSNNTKHIPDAKVLNLLKAPHRALTSEDFDDHDVTEGGSIKLWRVEGTQRVSVSKEKYGHFYSKDCYVLLYKVLLFAALLVRCGVSFIVFVVPY